MIENEFYEMHFFAEHLIKDAGEIIKKNGMNPLKRVQKNMSRISLQVSI